MTATDTKDPFAQLKEAQKKGWGLFAPLESITVPIAAILVEFAEVRPGQKLLDCACGTGVVAITAARLGAKVQALDLAPALVERAKQNAALAGVAVDFVEGDVEALPYPDAAFDVVLSQFGHMFAPRPDVAIRELLRVLKPGGRIAFTSWPPDHFVGRLFALTSQYAPPPPGAAPPPAWGDPNIVRDRLGTAVKDVVFDREVMRVPALSPAHVRELFEKTLAPIVKFLADQKDDAAKIARFRAELEGLITTYTRRNVLRQHFLLTRATKG